MSDRSLKQHYAEPIKNPSGPILSTSTLYTTLFIKQLPRNGQFGLFDFLQLHYIN